MGCGRVGAGLAGDLSASGNDVTVIDKDQSAFLRLGPAFGGKTITGMGFDRAVLERAGTADADAFAAVSSGDNSNIIAARVARESFGIERVIARIYDSRRAEVFERLGIPTIATTPWTTRRFYRFLTGAPEAEPWADPTGSVVVAVREATAPIVGRSVRDIERAAACKVVAITRYGDCFLPGATVLVQAEDLLHLAVTADAVDLHGPRLLDREGLFDD